VIARGGDAHGFAKLVPTVLGIGSVLVSWFVHTTYTLRYAKLFYDDVPGGVSFKPLTRAGA
jgi:uncharacterized membrane protein